MRKILTYSGFVTASLVVVVVFVTATNYIQLAIATALYSLLVYFAFKVFPRKSLRHPSIEPAIEPVAAVIQPLAAVIQPLAKPVEKVEPVQSEDTLGITNIDKRMFLKLIGGVGLSLFLFSIFNKKAEGLFFKSLPTSGKLSLENIAGDKIDPAQSHPTDGYKISEIDDSDIAFYGFINKDGAWFIMKEDTIIGSFRYARGDSNFPGNWTNRENLKYDYFNNVF